MSTTEIATLGAVAVDARERLDETRAEAAKAWKAFADRRDELQAQEDDPTSEEVVQLDELHDEDEQASEASKAAEDAWLRSIESSVQPRGKTEGRRKFSKSLLTALDNGKALVSPTGAVIAPQVLDVIVGVAHRQRSLLSLLTVLATTGDEVRYLQATTETLAADTVAPGAVKPTSILTTQVRSAPVTTIATVSEPVDRAVVADYALFGQWLENELRTAVELATEDQVISGSGTAPDLRGIKNTVGTLAVPYATSVIDTLASALGTLEGNNVVATGIAMNPADWWSIRVAREGTGATSGGYLLGDPSLAGPATIFGVPVVRTTAVTAGEAIVADWSAAALVVREASTIAWADAHSDLFIRNQMIVRVENRVRFSWSARARSRLQTWLPDPLPAPSPMKALPDPTAAGMFSSSRQRKLQGVSLEELPRLCDRECCPPSESARRHMSGRRRSGGDEIPLRSVWRGLLAPGFGFLLLPAPSAARTDARGSEPRQGRALFAAQLPRVVGYRSVASSPLSRRPGSEDGQARRR